MVASVAPQSSRFLPQARRIVGSGDESDGVLNQIHRLQHVTERTVRTVRQFANEILLGIFLFVDISLPQCLTMYE